MVMVAMMVTLVMVMVMMVMVVLMMVLRWIVESLHLEGKPCQLEFLQTSHNARPISFASTFLLHPVFFCIILH